MKTQELVALLERLSLREHYGRDLKDHRSVPPGHRIDACSDEPCPEIREAVAKVGAMGEDLTSVYRERNAVVAALIRTNGWPAALMAAPDAEGWWVVYAETPQGQVSWHIHPSDVRLFSDVPELGADWDGHDTDTKYGRIAALGRGARLAEGGSDG